MTRTILKAVAAAAGFCLALAISSIAMAGVPTFDEYSHILRDLHEQGDNSTDAASENATTSDGAGPMAAEPVDIGSRIGQSVREAFDGIANVRKELAEAVQAALAKTEDADHESIRQAEEWILRAQRIRHQALHALNERLDSWQIDEDARERLEERTAELTRKMERKSRELVALARRYDEVGQDAVRQAEKDLDRLAEELERVWRDSGYPYEEECVEAP